MLVLSALFFSLAAATPLIRGVAPEKQHLYQPLREDPAKWSCLNDSSIVLDYSRINDGICDCPDGSDEPGTDACPGKSLFYCNNDGFIPRYISAHKVNDGVCDCCDCSDEYLREPFSYSESCYDLRSNFETILYAELQDYEAGVRKLKKLQRRSAGTGIQHNDVERIQSEMEVLQNYISDVSEALVRNQDGIESIEESFRKKLLEESPQLLEYENLDMAFITASISDYFTHAQKISHAYNELQHILSQLYESYNRKLKDKVVIKRMNQFAELERVFRKSFQPDGGLDTTQRDQINEYLTKELPTFLFEGKTKYTPDIMVAKSVFVSRIISAKVKTKELTIDGTKQFQELADDIVNNHDVNFQDAAVKSFTDSYMNFLSKNEDALKEEVVLPQAFWVSFDKVLDFVKRVVPTITVVSDSDDSEWSPSRLVHGVLSHFKVFSPSLSSYRTQLNHMKEQRLSLKRNLRKSKKEVSLLQKKLSEASNSSRENLTDQVGSLLNSLTNFCVESKLNSYVYKLCFAQDNTGRIVQREERPDGSEVIVGLYTGFKIDTASKYEDYLNSLQNRYPDSDIARHLFSDTIEVGKQDILLGNLPDLNNGLTLEYEKGTRCWNGPLRSAHIHMRCAPEFKIESVSEPTKCFYLFEMTGPLGCDPNFSYQPLDN